MTPDPDKQSSFTSLYRGHAGRVLAALIAQLGDFQLAEDALQDAWVEALSHWPEGGLPQAPEAWLLTVARRRAIDRLRRRATRAANAADLKYAYELENEWQEPAADIPDERLRLIFTCCHPTLKLEHQVALTLHTLCGLSTAAIARAFLVSETTMAQRLVRAKRKIRDAGIPYRVPPASQLGERQDAVRTVVYLTFNEGFAATSGSDVLTAALCDEAIGLARMLNEQQPTPENAGLLALMLLHDSRRPARTAAGGDYVPLDQQDRSLWLESKAREGKQILLRALALGAPGPYQLQAAISAVHSDSRCPDDTDWAQIAGLYNALYDLNPTPVVALNRALAIANAESPAVAMPMIDQLSEALQDYQPFYAARAECLVRLERRDDAAVALRRAIELTDNAAEAAYLKRKLDALL